MIVSLDQVTGYLAMWAVRQSPYDVPDNLEDAVQDFRTNLPLARLSPPMHEFVDVADEGALHEAIKSAIEATPAIRAWNERKNKNQSPFQFVSRYDGPSDPDNDFIDLGALARNTSLYCWREMQRDWAFDRNFDREWNSWGARFERFVARMRGTFA